MIIQYQSSVTCQKLSVSKHGVPDNFSKINGCVFSEIIWQVGVFKKTFFLQEQVQLQYSDAAILAAAERYLSRNKVIGPVLCTVSL